MDQYSNNKRVVFESEQFARKSYSSAQASALTRLVMNMSGGAIKSTQQANVVMLVIAVICVVATFTVINWGGEDTKVEDRQYIRENGLIDDRRFNI